MALQLCTLSKTATGTLLKTSSNYASRLIGSARRRFRHKLLNLAGGAALLTSSHGWIIAPLTFLPYYRNIFFLRFYK
jgi:hypothetical protein